MNKKLFFIAEIIFILMMVFGCVPEDNEELIGETPTKAFVMNSYFQDKMVLQQNQPLNIFGKSEPGVVIDVKLFKKGNNRVVAGGKVLTDENGDWLVSLPAMRASYQLYTLFINDSVYNKGIDDILIGEVWLTSGEKNMRWPLKYTKDASTYISSYQNNEYIRYFSQDQYPNYFPDSQMSMEPVSDFTNGRWYTTNCLKLGDASAIGYIFACELFNYYNKGFYQVPVAFIESAVDDSNIAAWLPKKAIDESPMVRKHLELNNEYLDADDFNDQGKENYNQMSVLYNHKINPLKDINVQGVIWYQGISDMGQDAYYAEALSMLISSWRDLFGKQTKFMIIQEHSYEQENLEKFRLTQILGTNRFNDVAVVPTYDLDPEYLYQVGYDMDVLADNLPFYPINKIDLAKRLTNVATTLAYHDSANHLPPRNQGYTISLEENYLLIRISNCNQLLIKDLDGVVKVEETTEETPIIKHLKLVLQDDTEVDAIATIVKNEIKITYEDVTAIKAIKYACEQKISDANLTNELGMPVLPFIISINW